MYNYIHAAQQGLALRRHHHALLPHARVFFPPQTRDGLHLRVEVQARFAVEKISSSALHDTLADFQKSLPYAHPRPARTSNDRKKSQTHSDALLIPAEAEHRQRHRNRHVNANLSSFDVLLEMRGGAAGSGEYGDAIAVLVGIDDFDCGVEGGHLERDKDGAEDLLRVAFHVRADVGDECGTDLGVGC